MRPFVRAASLAAICLAMAGCQSSPSTPPPPPPGAPGASAAPPTKAAKKGVIGVSLLTMSNPFFVDMGNAMKAEAEKLGYEVVLTAGENDAAKQKDQINDFIAKKVNAIVLAPCDSRSVGTSIQEANKAGIPVFTADIACLDKAAKVVCHIATDNYAGGKVAGQAMIDALGGKGKIAIISHPEVESGMLRTKGFKEVVAGAKGIKVVAEQAGLGDREKSYTVAQDILQANPELDGIFAINDPTAMGVVAALEKAKRADKVKVIGFDGMPEVKQAIKAGKVWGDAVQYPEKIGALTVQTIDKYMAGTKPDAQILIPTGLYKQADALKDTSLK